MDKKLEHAKELIDFIYESPSVFHVVDNVNKKLTQFGYLQLKESDKWNLVKGGKYFVEKNGSALIAFVVGEKSVCSDGFKIIAAHTDSPTFKVKPLPEIKVEGEYLKLNTEVYGGPILNTWFDRPLSIAGRVTVKSSNSFHPISKLINIKRPILIIPNLAIHMNREVNSGVKLNKQKDMLPLLSMLSKEMQNDNLLLKIISKEINVDIQDILDFDLYLYEFDKGCIMGLNNEFISSGKLDDLSMVHSGIKALSESSPGNATNVMVCFDNEEVGSTTKQGAHSTLLSSILERIVISDKGTREDYFRALSNSFMISCDSAHAMHPNYIEKADLVNRPLLNKGPVIKLSASQSYATDSISSSVYEMICKSVEVPVQKFVNRSDERGGSTIGPICSVHVNIRCVDMGTPLLAMHSSRELGGVDDQYFAYTSFTEFYKKQ